MSSNNISIRPGNDGIVDLPGLNVSSVLYIKGKKFEDYITELVLEDQFEQAEITELKLLVQYLDTSGLNSAWLVDNQNKNQDLKTAITALQTKLAQIDTTALTESSVLTNDNRNSVLKTRIDGHDGNLSSLTTKTQYLTSVVGNNGDPRTPSTFNVTIGDREKRQLLLTTGNNYINCQNDSTNQAEIGNYADNKIQFISQTGMVQSIAHFNSIQCIDKLEITGFAGMGIQSSPNIIIGNKGAQIKIGSEDTPELNSTNTIISIGKRSITKNTETRLQGNIKIVDARFDELTRSQAITWELLGSRIKTIGMPAWILSFILTSSSPNYVYSDLWAMKGNITKDGDVETTQIPKMKGFSVFDSSILDVSILPKVQTFIAQGDISSTQLLGSWRTQIFDGEILLRNNNVVSTNIDWDLTEQGNKVNYIKISNNDMEMALAGGATNSQMRIGNYITNGKIKFRMGSGGIQANAHDALSIFNDQASSQVLIAGSNVPTGYDTSSKLLVDHQNLTHGIKVTKGNEANITRVNHNNINTPSLTLQTNWGGAIQNTLYLNASNQLMYNGSAVGAGAGGGTSTGGIIFLLRGPTTSVTYTAANLTTQTLTAADSYTGLAQRSIKLTSYSAGTTYNIYTHRGAINKSTNPVIKGIWEYVINLSHSSNQPASIFTDVYFFGNQNAGSSAVLKKTYASADQAGTGFISIGGTTYTPYWFINKYQFQFIFTTVTFNLFNYRGADMVFRCVLEDDSFTPLYTFPDITRTSNSGGTNLTVDNLIFTAPSQQTITQGFLFTGTKMRFKVTLVSGTSVGGFSVYYSQPEAASPTNMSFTVPTGSYSTPLSLNINNQKSLFFDTAAMRQYELTIPIEEFDLTVFESPNFDIRFNFIQPSGTTSNHFIEAFFNDGSLSHCHTALNITNAIPRLDQVCAVSASTNNSIYFSNGSGIQNISFITDTNSIPYSVKAINAGAGISISETANGIWSIASNTASSSTRTFRYFNNGIHVPKAVFNLGTPIDLRTNRVRGMIRAQLQPASEGTNSFQFPFLDFNNFHSYPTQTQSAVEMNWITEISNGRQEPMYENSTYPARTLTHGRNANIAQIAAIGAQSVVAEVWFVTHFDITALYNNGFGNTQGLSCIGNHVMITKNLNTYANQYVMGDYNRHSQLNQSFNLTHIGFGSFTFYAANKGMQFCELNIEIIPYSPNTIQSSVGPV